MRTVELLVAKPERDNTPELRKKLKLHGFVLDDKLEQYVHPVKGSSLKIEEKGGFWLYTQIFV